jgi:hypothetical protein
MLLDGRHRNLLCFTEGLSTPVEETLKVWSLPKLSVRSWGGVDEEIDVHVLHTSGVHHDMVDHSPVPVLRSTFNWGIIVKS